jgi:uncharacterized membrane protein
MKTNQTWLAMLAAVAALAAAQTGLAGSPQSRYTVTDLGTLPGLDYSYVWGGVNRRGHVAGYATNSADPSVFDDSSSFLWKGPGKLQLLPQLPDATATIAFALNDFDQVVGSSGPTPEGYLAVLWQRGTIKTLGKLPGHTDSDAFGINNPGLVVGHSLDFNVDPWTSTAVFWNKGKICPLPPLAGATNSGAVAVSEWGQIVGYSGSRAVLWSTCPKARVIDLGTLGGDGSSATDINEWGQVVGQAQTAFGDWLPVLWNGMDIIELPIPNQDVTGSAMWINNRGQAVGFSGSDPEQADLHGMRALLWEDGEVIKLQNQIPANSGWKLRQATGINDHGQITGFGQHQGKMRAFLLTPTVAPKPTVTGSTDPNASAVAGRAARKPVPSESLWPPGAKIVVTGFSWNPLRFGHILSVKWPIASGADHYRLTATEANKAGGPSSIRLNQSPASYQVKAKGWASTSILLPDPVRSRPGPTQTKIYTTTVTAYSGPDEATAHSESLQCSITVQ